MNASMAPWVTTKTTSYLLGENEKRCRVGPRLRSMFNVSMRMIPSRATWTEVGEAV